MFPNFVKIVLNIKKVPFNINKLNFLIIKLISILFFRFKET